MKRAIPHLACMIFLWIFFINGCTKDPDFDFEFPRNNPPPTIPSIPSKPPPPYLNSGIIDQSFTENFDGNYQLTGWKTDFHTEPHEPLGDWLLGGTSNCAKCPPSSAGHPPIGPAYEGKFVSVGRSREEIACSKWLFTPPIYLKDGDTVAFVTKADTLSNSINYLEVRLNERDSAIHVTHSLHSVGKYTKLVGEIKDDYPKAWKKIKYVVSGFPNRALSRIAFRYFMPEAKPGGAIGIDDISFIKR